MVINWTLQLLSQNMVFLFHLISLGKLSSIPLLNMHLKSSVSPPRARGVFSSSHLLSIYKSQIRPSLEYCSHVWGGAPKSTLCPFDKVQSKAIRLINYPNLTKSLQPLSHRLLVGDLSIFCGHCSKEIRDIIPVPLRCVRTTRSSTHSHPFQVSLSTPRTLSHKSSFIPSQEHAFDGTSCLLLAFLSPTTCHLSNLRLINLTLSIYPLSCSLSSFFLCWGFV